MKRSALVLILSAPLVLLMIPAEREPQQERVKELRFRGTGEVILIDSEVEYGNDWDQLNKMICLTKHNLNIIENKVEIMVNKQSEQ